MSETTLQITAKPVTIISGFLGAGKTSFLNEYIGYRKNVRPAIIENEFGEQGIDAGLIVAPDADVFELNNGCICCSLNEELLDVLEQLWQKKDNFDELIIETTGIADPATVAQPFVAMPGVTRFYRLERVICIVDAHLIEQELQQTEEARKQIAFADIIILNKCDIISSEKVAELQELLSNINPFATIFSGSKSSGYPLKEIGGLTRAGFDNNLNVHSNDEHEHHHAHEHHHHGISSLSFVFEQPFDLEWFEHALWMFLKFQASEVYRVKGFLWASGYNRKIIVQSVAGMLAISEGKEWDAGEEKKSRIVIIGRNLKSKGFEKMLNQCLDKVV